MFKCIKFFSFRKNALNDATINYVEILEKSFKEIGFDFIYCKSLSEINNGDIVLTIEVKDLFLLSLYKRNLKFINWYQGIVPEEAILMKKSWIRKIYLDFFEKTALKKCILNIFVSDAMNEHYQRKYKQKINSYFIMPCFNKEINLKSFQVVNKYERPTFVYAGSMHEWQCIDRMLDIYMELKSKLVNATLTILTSEIEVARKKLSEKGLNVNVKYVELSKLDEELSIYKYGFLIRDDIPVNRVSTPTKLNSYMANGIIPIFSNVISYYSNLNINNKIDLNNNSHDIQKIFDFENKSKITSNEILKEYTNLFSEVFSESNYINKLKIILKDIIV